MQYKKLKTILFIKNDIKFLDQILVFFNQKSSLHFKAFTKMYILRHVISTIRPFNCDRHEIIRGHPETFEGSTLIGQEMRKECCMNIIRRLCGIR